LIIRPPVSASAANLLSSQDQQATIVYPQEPLNPAHPSSDVAHVVRDALMIGLRESDTIHWNRSQGGAHVVISRSGRVVPRLYLLSFDGSTWSFNEITLCRSSGVGLGA
jgi:hypothetical protein